MYGAKPAENNIPRTVHQEWKWTDPEYDFTTERRITEIKSIEIDPTHRLADINSGNDKLVVPN